MIDLKVLIIETAEEAASRALEKTSPPSRYFKSRDAAKYLGVVYITLETWRARGKGPDFSRLGRIIRYDRKDLEAFMLSHRHECDGTVGISRNPKSRSIEDANRYRPRPRKPMWTPKKIYG